MAPVPVVVFVFVCVVLFWRLNKNIQLKAEIDLRAREQFEAWEDKESRDLCTQNQTPIER
jgi:predicted Holliday junction resolvase-like endonuclease